MASEKPTRILLSKTDLTIDEIKALSDKEAWELIYSTPNKKKDDRFQICFTGFGVSEKEKLINLARDNRFKVVSSVTKELNYLVCGIGAGPAKIEKAESQGSQLLNEEEFLKLIEKR